MSESLVRFIEATMSKRLNDLDNPHNLPAILAGTKIGGHRLVPLTADEWDLGAFKNGTTVATNIAQQWWQFVEDDADGHTMVPDIGGTKELNKRFVPSPSPDKPLPVVTTRSITVTGLDNVQLGPLTGLDTLADGYRLTIPLLFGRFKGTTLPETITVAGHYQLDQSVSVMDKGTTTVTAVRETLPDVKWPVDTVTGTGTFALGVEGLAVDAVLRVQLTGSGGERGLQVTLESLTPRGESAAQPVYTLDRSKLTIDQSTKEVYKKPWLDAAEKAFDDPESAPRLTDSLKETLNTKDTLTAIADALTERLGAALDAVFKTHTAAEGGSSGNNPVDQYLFDRLRAAVADETSPFYPPTLITGMAKPTVEPYTVDKVVIGEISLSSELKPLENVTFTGLSIRGCSNTVAPPELAALTAGRVSAVLKLSTLTSRPRPLDASGKLTADWGTHKGLPGDFAVLADEVTIATDLSFSGTELDDLAITIDSLIATVPDQGLTITVDLSGGTGEHPAVEEYANEALKRDEIKEQIVKRVNEALQKQLPDLGPEVSRLVREAIAQRLDAPSAS
ncbi:hypothetical protein [Kitasatospora sp. NPDC091207]|uniref:hypothetical protein n=1 Tax=Kitasatospora sp. NPDC091207 TaxID=3364083 RepID=UPI0037F9329C